MANDNWLGFNAYCTELEDAKKRVGQWYNEGFDRGQALVLAGNTGCGKTHLARVILNICPPHLVLMVSEPDMLAAIKATYSGDGNEGLVINNYKRAHLLIIDDVGTAHVKEQSRSWLHEIYWRIFDRRAERFLPTMLTTNLHDLDSWLGKRALSRLLGMMGNKENYVDLFSVADYRRRDWK